MTDYESKITEIKFLNDERVVGMDYQIGKVLRIQQETKNSYLVYYEFHIERIHKVKIALMSHDSKNRMVY